MAKRKIPYKGVPRRYQWKLYPTKEQDAILHVHSDMCIDLWNALLEITERRFQRAIQRHGKHITFHCAECAALSEEAHKLKLCEDHRQPSYETMCSWITEMREECPEWQVLSVNTPRRVANSLMLAYNAFYRRAREGKGKSSGYPRFKSKRRSQPAVPHICASGCKVTKSDRHEKSWWVYLKGVTDNVWARGQLPAHVFEWTDADVRFIDRAWFISVAIDIEKRRVPSQHRIPMTVKFGIIDGLCFVNNELVVPQGMILVQELSEACDRKKSDFDIRWPHTQRYTDEEWKTRCEERAEISKLESRVKRLRKHVLHTWSSNLVEKASLLTIIKPPIQENTKTPCGDEEHWGAAVETVSNINRNTLSYAPAMAANMLKYKAEELGIQVQVIENDLHDLKISGQIVSATKKLRYTRRKAKELNLA